MGLVIEPRGGRENRDDGFGLANPGVARAARRTDGRRLSLLETARLHCPYCGEPVEIVIDCTVARQDYVEDCEVCCRPMRLQVAVDSHGIGSVEATREDDA
jgi:hypothetical protein